MELPKDKNTSWLEVRKIFPVIAGLVMLAAIFLPFWSVAMTAPQYPEQDLEIRIYANRMEGDIDEYNILNQYVGVSFPDYLPEFQVFPYLLAGFGVMSMIIGLGPSIIRKRGLAALLILFFLFLIGGVVDLQYRLHIIGHNLDPKAPMQGIGTFTPPILGPNKVWNFTTLSLVRSGGFSLGLAFVLILSAFLNRNNGILVGQYFKQQKNKLSNLLSKKSTHLLFLWAITGTFMLLVMTGVEAASNNNLVVSTEEGYNSISEALAAAADGSTIIVKPGSYRENLVINKSIKLIGEGNPVIDGDGSGHVVILAGGNIILQGFVITNSGQDLVEEDAGIYVISDNNQIIDNQVVDNTFGIYLYKAHHNRVEKNLVTGIKDINVEERGNGLHLWYAEHNTVKKNIVRYTRDGLYFSFAHNNEISFNELTHQRYGVHYMYSNNNLLQENIFKHNTVGAALMFSQNNKITGNVASYNKTHGILYKDFDDNVLAANVLTHNQQGMFLYNSQSNEIKENYLANNQRGIHIAAGSQDNRFWRNSFVQNRQQLEHPDPLRNYWDNGAEGNFWSDYIGYDVNGNGIGEFPYRPNRLVEDLIAKYPLTKLLYNSPVMQVLQLAEKSFPLLRPNGIVDNYPLMKPVAQERKEKISGQGSSDI